LDEAMTKPSPAALATARLYLCTDSRRDRGDLAGFLDAVLANGVDIVQLREKNLEAADELAALEVFADACRRHSALLAVNDRADLAVAAGADVLHLGQRDLAPVTARRIVGPDVLIGLSSHSTEQARAAAAAAEVDYFCLGPLWATPTKPGRPHTGLAPVAALAAASPAAGLTKPWFGIGGIDETTLDQVLDAGARRVVVVRVLTEAADPGATAARLAQRLAATG
jgi:thiamine-phosphate pyrophosphorylase